MRQIVNRNRKRKFRLPFSALLLYLVLMAVTLFGVTFSKYITGTTPGDTARVAVMRNLAVTETGSVAEPDQWIVTPGVDLIKNAAVDFEGSVRACYIYCEIKATGWRRWGLRSFAYIAEDENLLEWSVKADWNYLSGEEDGAVYYRTVEAKTALHAEVLADGGKISVSKNITKTQLDSLPADLSIKISAAAVQYHGFSEGLNPVYTEDERAAAAWTAVKNK